MHFFATYGQISDYLKHFFGKYGGNMQKLAKLATFKNFKKIDFVPKNPPKNFWKTFIFLFLEKMHSFPQNIENSAHFMHFWPEYGAKWPKSGKKSKKFRKNSRRPKKKFRTIFFYIFGKNTYFPAKYRKFSPFLGFQAFFWKKSKILKNIRKK